MAFPDPQTLTLAGVAKTLNKISTEVKGRTGQPGSVVTTVYQTTDELIKLIISHQKTGSDRIRSTIRWEWRKVVADPVTAVNDYQTLVDSRTFDRPSYGFSETDLTDLNTAIEAWTDNTVIGRIFGQQS